MKYFHRLTLDAACNGQTVGDYEMGDFDLTVFWDGSELNMEIPKDVRLFVDGPRADYVGNPLSWSICSKKLVDFVSPLAENDFQLFKAPLHSTKTGRRVNGYYVMNVIRRIGCVNLQQSTVEYKNKKTQGVEMIYEYVFDSGRIPDSVHIFRPDEFPQAVFFSDELARSLMGKGLTGLAFIRCNAT